VRPDMQNRVSGLETRFFNAMPCNHREIFVDPQTRKPIAWVPVMDLRDAQAGHAIAQEKLS